MKNWQEFENEIANYLKEMLRDYDLTIKQLGDADSTTPDIEIILNKNLKNFFIETKMPHSQTSQFVVEIVDNKFIYSQKNKFKSNEFAEDIIKILNNNFSFYKNVKQNAIELPVPETIALGWIASNMKNKNVEFIMSIDNYGNEKTIPVDSFNNFFNIKTTLRRKKSGSSSISKKYYNDFKSEFSKKFTNVKYCFFENKGKLFVKIPINLEKHECYINSSILTNNRKYFLSKKDDNIYEVKITSRTNNPNVIFELSPKSQNNLDAFTIQGLIDYILNNEKDD